MGTNNSNLKQPKRYAQLKSELAKWIPGERLIEEPLQLVAYGTDAGFYRLTPKLVVKIINENETIKLLKLAQLHDTPVTFRAAGTSLSGQAISDSILAVLDDNYWREYKVYDEGKAIQLQVGIVGYQANRYLKKFDRKIGPDPASIDSAKIGGIAANNASGMCCGVDQNSYKTLKNMRVIFADGSILDTASRANREAFIESHPKLINSLTELGNKTRSNTELSAKITRKFKIKNTTGYSLNALVDYIDPIDIIQHLMIGSEGTLGFISEITYKTLPDHSDKASSLILFPDVATACSAVLPLKKLSIDAVEIMDRAALRSIENQPEMPPFIKDLNDHATALLIETRAANRKQLHSNIENIKQSLSSITTLTDIQFAEQPEEYEQLWKVRKGLFPSVGAMREIGTTVVIEDVAFPLHCLSDATNSLQKLFQKHGYNNAIIFGHALAGNLHFVLTPNFNDQQETNRYRLFMDDLCHMVVEQFDGSLKAEHSTGRNIAPYVELEWGNEAYQLMKEIKNIFDPHNLLNPGVILNDDPEIHLKNIKPIVKVDPDIDKCIECGFCEVTCPSRNFTLTPRQRIVSMREQVREKSIANHSTINTDQYKWFTIDTCAADGLCAIPCPVGIDTGAMVLKERAKAVTPRVNKNLYWAADHIGLISNAGRMVLNTLHRTANLTGNGAIEQTSSFINRISRGAIPIWDQWIPRGSKLPRYPSQEFGQGNKPKVVYFSSCINRVMGTACNDKEKRDISQVVISLLQKAGYDIVTIPNLDSYCCGLPFNSKGAIDASNICIRKLEEALWQSTQQGKLPVICDSSPCTARMVNQINYPIEILEPVEFTLKYLVDKLTFDQQAKIIALHIPCGSRKHGLANKFVDLAHLCSEIVFQPEDSGCCGFAGDKGFLVPELNKSALKRLKSQLPDNCSEGYSTSRTCEIGLSRHSGINYRSILYLVDRCSREK